MIPTLLAAGSISSELYQNMKPALYILIVILAALTVCCIICSSIAFQRRRKHSALLAITGLLYVATAVTLVCTCLCFGKYRSLGNALLNTEGTNPTTTTSGSTNSTQTNPTAKPTDPTVKPTDKPTEPTVKPTEKPTNPTTTPTVPPTTVPPTTVPPTTVPPTTVPTTEPPAPDPAFTPMRTDKTDPNNWGIDWEIIHNGAIVSNYQRPEPITFGDPDDYFVFPGISTFRGNNHRNSAVYGTATVIEKTLTKAWSRDIGTLNGWPGSGWTGQPLMVQWDNETKAVMNMYDSKKAKDGLVEVIYATLDGYIYFYDLDDGSYTRNPLYIGMNFKGAGTIDPRGYPILYVGSGDYIGNRSPRMYIISLIDGKILYERSGDDAFRLRDWVAFDSSPLVDAETDTLIWPGESGILYTIKLNSSFDKATGTLTIKPEDAVRTRYCPDRYTGDTYWLGYEDSAVIVDHYLYLSENGGLFFCIDLNTMELIWTQDTKDDSNSTPVFEWNGPDSGYLYTAPSLHWTASNGAGYISIYKLNAITGEIVWERKFDCHTISGVSGGVQSSPLLGKPGTKLEGLIIYTISRSPNVSDGKLVAFDTETGETVWEMYMPNYAWSSPLAVYDEDGNGYIIVSDSVGKMIMLDHEGTVLSTVYLGSNVEASPAVFGNTLVVGTRGQKIYGIKIK